MRDVEINFVKKAVLTSERSGGSGDVRPFDGHDEVENGADPRRER